MASGTFCDRPRAGNLSLVTADLRTAARYLGAGAGDAAACELLHSVEGALTAAAQPRMAWASLTLPALEAQGLLQGADIRRHLAGCSHAVLLAATLGPRADLAIRRAGVGDVARLAAADAAASALAEAAADAAEAALRQEFTARGLYLTGRYSPGYGDYPLAVQPLLCTLLDSARLLGVTVGPTNLLTPRKSITAVLGVSEQPVRGHRAGCAHCALRETCEYRKRGQTCAGE